MKLICERTTFIPGFCVFSWHDNDFGMSPGTFAANYPTSPTACPEWLL